MSSLPTFAPLHNAFSGNDATKIQLLGKSEERRVKNFTESVAEHKFMYHLPIARYDLLVRSVKGVVYKA